MPFPSVADPLARALVDAQTTARSLKTQLQGASTAMAAGNVSANVIIETHLALVTAKAMFTRAAAVPGMAAYARDQFGDTGLDIAAEFTAMNSAVTNAIAWVTTNYPKDAAGYALKDKLVATGIDVRVFTPAQTAGFRTELDGVIATIA